MPRGIFIRTEACRAKLSLALQGNRNGVGHSHPQSSATRAKISAAKKGCVFTEEHRAKLSAAHVGKKMPPEQAMKISVALRGCKRSPETCAKIGAAHRGRKSSPEICAAISARMMGQRYAAGHHYTPSEETRHQKSLAMRGNGNPQWRNGLKQNPYAWTFNAELKAEVRERDAHKCQVCGVSQKESERILQVHHVDYDKNNSDPVNLITLCLACHGRTTTNRDYWKAELQDLMIRKCRLQPGRA
jgi:hypothetical protein